MIVKSKKLGEFEVDDNFVINFVSPILGYENLKNFVLAKLQNDDLFTWLQSVEDSEIALPVASCDTFGVDCSYEVDDEILHILDVSEKDNITVLNIINIPNGKPKEATINLLAPIFINKANKRAIQYVFSGSNLPVRKRIFELENI